MKTSPGSLSRSVVIDPIASGPVFIALTQKSKRASVTKTAILTAAGLLFMLAVAGMQLLSIFGIINASFLVAGGILLFIVRIELLTHGDWRFGSAGAQGEAGVIPLALPLLAGPGAITVVMISFQRSGLAVTAHRS